MFIEILYSDLSKQRVSIEEADKLPKTGVLAIIFSGVEKKNPRITINNIGYSRMGQWLGKDYYYLLRYKDGSGYWYGIDARDEREQVTFHKTNRISSRREHPRYNCWMLVFEGEHVTEEKWAEAMKLFKGVH